MAMDWGQFHAVKNAQEGHKLIVQHIRPDNYGDGDGEWSLTELINARSAPASAARRYIEGVDSAGKKLGQGPMKAANGRELEIKLRVISRQACTEDKDGHGINTWDTTEINPENYNNEYCPTSDEKPHEGDVVWVKGDAMTHDPATGEPLVKRYRLALVARVEAQLGRKIKPHLATHYHEKYPVDADGCITVSYLTAVQLLTLKGRGLVLPQFKGGARRGSDVKTRQITNWLFEEVFKGDEKPKAKRRAASADAS